MILLSTKSKQCTLLEKKYITFFSKKKKMLPRLSNEPQKPKYLTLANILIMIIRHPLNTPSFLYLCTHACVCVCVCVYFIFSNKHLWLDTFIEKNRRKKKKNKREGDFHKKQNYKKVRERIEEKSVKGLWLVIVVVISLFLPPKKVPLWSKLLGKSTAPSWNHCIQNQTIHTKTWTNQR